MKLFFIGINGIGMQGLAYIAAKQGHTVFGFDDNDYKIPLLEQVGVHYQNFLPENIDYIVFSSAINENHLLMKSGSKKNIPKINRTQFLIEHIKLNPNIILIAGAHGKTTTSSMLAYSLGLHSFLVGGVIKNKNCAEHEENDYTVIESDESDGSFLQWQAKYKILLNFDFEHMDYFKTEENAIFCYRKFALQDIENSFLVIEDHAKTFLNIPDHKNIFTYSHLQESDIEYLENGLRIRKSNQFLPLFGLHNANNWQAISTLIEKCGIQTENNIANFPGVHKRMDEVTPNFYSDYGHHPKEVKATLDSFFMHKKLRPQVILEPHKFSRLEYTWDLWPSALKNHEVYITEIYAPYKEDVAEHITQENFIKFLNENGVQASKIEFDDIKPDKPTICFSAGKLSEKLSKKAIF